MSDGGWIEVGGMPSSDLNFAIGANTVIGFMEDDSVRLIHFQIYAKNWNINSLIQDRNSLFDSTLWCLLNLIPFFSKIFDKKIKRIDEEVDVLRDELSDLEKKLSVKIKVNDIWSYV